MLTRGPEEPPGSRRPDSRMSGVYAVYAGSSPDTTGPYSSSTSDCHPLPSCVALHCGRDYVTLVQWVQRRSGGLLPREPFQGGDERGAHLGRNRAVPAPRSEAADRRALRRDPRWVSLRPIRAHDAGGRFGKVTPISTHQLLKVMYPNMTVASLACSLARSTDQHGLRHGQEPGPRDFGEPR